MLDTRHSEIKFPARGAVVVLVRAITFSPAFITYLTMLDCGCLSHGGGVCLWELASSLASSAVPSDLSIGSGSDDVPLTDNNSSVPDPAPVLVCAAAGSISLPTLIPNDVPALITPTNSPQASPLSKPVQLSELSRCPVPPMSRSTRQQQHARPRPILPERTGSSSKQGHKRKAADGHGDGIHANKRQNVFLPVVKAPSSSSSAGNNKGEGSKNSNNKRRPSSSSSRSRSPKSPRSSSPAIPTARVLTIAPTVRGISEAARILRNSTSSAATATTTNKRSNSQSPITQGETDSKSSPRSSLTNTPAPPSGILSFPTETVYTLSTCVRLRPNHHLHHPVKSSLGTCTSSRERNGRSESSSSASSISSSSSSSSDGEACPWLGQEKGHASLNTRK